MLQCLDEKKVLMKLRCYRLRLFSVVIIKYEFLTIYHIIKNSNSRFSSYEMNEALSYSLYLHAVRTIYQIRGIVKIVKNKIFNK